MCIIAVSKIGVRQPSMQQLKQMFDNNPHGAGYMYARDGKVAIHKGFMTWEDFRRAVLAENFTAKDPVVYHFRISTQAGITPEMTHPFPLTSDIKYCEKLDITACSVGVAHNGVIRMTSNAKETRFSDTALFIAQYLTKLVRRKQDVTDPAVLTMIDHLTNSRWALLTENGEIGTVGTFIDEHGLLFSNSSYKPYKPAKTVVKFSWDDYYNGAYGYPVK